MNNTLWFKGAVAHTGSASLFAIYAALLFVIVWLLVVGFIIFGLRRKAR